MTKILCFVVLISSMACATELVKIEGEYDQTVNRAAPGSITIDLNKVGQNIDKNFYGSHLDSNSPVPAKEFIDELQLGKVRIGGNEYDVFNWKTNQSVTSGGEIKKINGFEKIATALNQCSISGIYQINLTGFQAESVGGSDVVKRSFNANSAYEMVKNLNGVLKLNIVDFSLGNEFSIWHETFSAIWPGEDGISADEYIDRYIQFALAIRKAQKEVNGNPNSIKIWGPEISSSWLEWNTGNFSKDCKWTDVPGQVACTYGNNKFDHFIPYFLYRLKMAENDHSLNPNGYKLLDYFSIHYYPTFRTHINDPYSIISDSSGRQLVAEMLESTRLFHDPTFVNQIDLSSFRNFRPNVLNRINEWIKQYYPTAKLAMNEFAVDSDYRTSSYHPIVRPLYLADSIGIFAKNNVSFLNQFILNSPTGVDVPWTMLEGGVNRTHLFYTFKLFSNHFLGTVVGVEDDLGDVINTYATVQGKYINLAIVNKDPIDKTVQIYVKNLFTKKIVTYTVPGWSTSILKIEKKPGRANSNGFEIYQYGAKEMGIALDPVYAKKP